jgi:KipI family sensor histidine kinase inhibitor
MLYGMGLKQLGDSAWLFQAELGDLERNHRFILRLRKLIEKTSFPQIVDVVVSFETIAVHFQPMHGEVIYQHLIDLQFDEIPDEEEIESSEFVIPVCYGEGDESDLNRLAEQLGVSVQELIDLHSGAVYSVAAIGFSPGFPYLLGLPEKLRTPRLSTPRKVGSGSVAIAGSQAGIYPNASQGGWYVLGKTDVQLFDLNCEKPSLLEPGDQVRFQAVECLDKDSISSAEESQLEGGDMLMLEAGPMTSVQDHGRYGYQSVGVSPGGAVDPIMATIANRLLGNTDHAAVLECTMAGPKMEFLKDTRIAFVGWGDERSGRPISVKAGEVIDLTKPTKSLRGYIAIAGGIDVPVVLGSRSTDLRASFGGYRGRELRQGDCLAIGEAGKGPVAGAWHIACPHRPSKQVEVRFLNGVQAHWFTDHSRRDFTDSVYRISHHSNRMGTRLEGAILELNKPREMVSQPVVFGSIQVPPSGQPIVLMSERQTIGGYPQIGHVISADLPIIARAWPGTAIRFREVSIEEARHAWFELQRDLGFLQTGLALLGTEK